MLLHPRRAFDAQLASHGVEGLDVHLLELGEVEAAPAPFARALYQARGLLLVRHLEDGVGALGAVVTRTAVAAVAAAVAALAVAVVALAALAASPAPFVPAAAAAVGPLRARAALVPFRPVGALGPCPAVAAGLRRRFRPLRHTFRGRRSRTLHARLDGFALRGSVGRLLVLLDLLVGVRHV